jgi:hypothetical protein
VTGASLICNLTCIQNAFTCKYDVLHFIKLPTMPSYEALSYIWGDTSVKNSITLNWETSSVTIKLECALYHLGQEDECSILWIDAICINQLDIPERNTQVRQMGRVYEQSKVTIVWLSEASEDSDSAMNFLGELEK